MEKKSVIEAILKRHGLLETFKLTATRHPGMAEGVVAFREAPGRKAGPGWLVHPGDTQLPLGANIRSLPFANL